MSWASEWREANMGRQRTVAQLVKQRQVQPHLMYPFGSGVTAAGLGDRPWDCYGCTWTLVAHGSPEAGFSYGPESRLKFPDRNCRVHGRFAGGGA